VRAKRALLEVSASGDSTTVQTDSGGSPSEIRWTDFKFVTETSNRVAAFAVNIRQFSGLIRAIDFSKRLET
jgi:hypothetical protein